MFKELLKDLVGEEISLIKTKSGDDWQEVLVEEINDEYVYLKGDGFTGYLRVDSIESITVEDEEDEMKEIN